MAILSSGFFIFFFIFYAFIAHYVACVSIRNSVEILFQGMKIFQDGELHRNHNHKSSLLTSSNHSSTPRESRIWSYLVSSSSCPHPRETTTTTNIYNRKSNLFSTILVWDSKIYFCTYIVKVKYTGVNANYWNIELIVCICDFHNSEFVTVNIKI